MKSASRPLAPWRRTVQILGGSTVLLFVAGCQTYQQQSASIVTSFKTSNIASAVASVDKEAKAHEGSKDEILWKLEQGATLRTAALADSTQLPPPPAVTPKDPAAPIPPPPTPAEISASYAKRSIDAFNQENATRIAALTTEREAIRNELAKLAAANTDVAAGKSLNALLKEFAAGVQEMETPSSPASK